MATPKGWRQSRLADVVLGAEYGVSVPLAAEGGIPVLRMMNLKDGKIDTSDLRFSDSYLARKLLLNDGDVLFNRTNSFDQVGKTAIWRGELPSASFASYCVRFTCDRDRMSPAYLTLAMNLPDTQRVIKQFATPAVQQVNVNPTVLRNNLHINHPHDVIEQYRIVDVIDSIDAAIKVSEDTISKLRKIKSGLFFDLLTFGNDDRSLIRRQAHHPDFFKEVSLGKILPIRNDRGISGLPVMSVTIHDGLQPRNPNERRVETKLVAEQHLLARKGDIAYNMMRMWQGACGIAQADCLLSPAYIVVQPLGVVPEFAYMLMKSEAMIRQFHKQSRGLTDDRLRLYYRDFSAITASIPRSLDEQRRIADILLAHDARIRSEETYRDKLKLQKRGLMSDLLTGRVRV